VRLSAVEIRDFRSVFVDDRGEPLRLELGSGMNTLVGPNNCGKSNVLRAVALALDTGYDIEPASDIAVPRPFSPPVVTLQFTTSGARAEDPVALGAAQAYEQGVGATSTYADRGQIHLQVSYRPTGTGHYERDEVLLTPDHRAPDPANEEHRRLLQAAIGSLRDAVRFVLVRSGESLESVLEGNFREILHTVIRERLEEVPDPSRAWRHRARLSVKDGDVSYYDENEDSPALELWGERVKQLHRRARRSRSPATPGPAQPAVARGGQPDAWVSDRPIT